MSEIEINLIDKYADVLQINKEVILKKDLRKLAKEHNITKKTLLKIMHERGFEYDRKQKGYICIKSATNRLKMASATLEDTVEKFILMQLEVNKKLLKQSHSSTDEIREEDTEIIDVEANYVADENWEYNKRSIKIDDKVWEDYVKVCETKYKGLKRQEITTIMFNQFVKENQ